MSRLLIVKAHPLDSQTSYVLRGVEILQSRYQQLHPEDEVECIDVFEDEVPVLDKFLLESLALAKKGETLTAEQTERIQAYQALTDQFLRADKIVIANPLWNLNVPSQLVSWINTINVAGVTFQYGKEGSIGLVKGKKVLHIQSNGGLYGGQDPAAHYIRSVFAFLGVTEVEQVFIEGQSAHPDQAERIFQEAMEQVERLLVQF